MTFKRHISNLKRWIAHTCGETPVETITHLDDDPKNIYVWVLHPATDRAIVDNLQQTLAHVQELNELKATHLILRDLTELRKLSKKEVEEYILPILEAD